jgi:HAD superfamily hydrolase (TIGR01457 family)
MEHVRCFLLDMDGTFYLGERLLAGALRLIEVLEAQGRDYLFLTNNSSKNRGQYAEKINRLGLPISEEKVFTSGEATARYLRKTRPQARLYVVGTPSLEEEFIQHGFILDEIQPEVAVLGFDTTLTYAKLWRLCDLVRGGIPYIATHPDLTCPTASGSMPDTGAMIAFVKASTGRDPDLVVGKPSRIIIDEVADKLEIAIDSLAMVGDRLYTDIALGQATGITTVLVLSGETKAEDMANSPFKPSFVFSNLGGLADHLENFGKPAY